jgi:DNA replicative helicase MCM subunit Mcm2 (Cdc46/Mcm family)
MNTICTELTTRIQNNKEKTRDLLAKTAVLQNEKKQLIAQQEYINGFFNKFSLTEDEEHAIKSDVLTDNYFKVLSKLCQIEININEAIELDPKNNKALMEMQKLIIEKMEAAYQNLFSATVRECRMLNVEFLELKPVLHQSLSALQPRQFLFEQVMSEYCTARKSFIVRAFIDALTKGRGSTKAIEHISNDPLRYVNEILGVVHQALELETELLQSLLKSCVSEIVTPTVKANLCNIAEALCQPLKLRIEKTLTRENNCVVLYRLSSLIKFYVLQFE